ncbi:hypothetical protein BJ508DRAFT_411655 [Ascobolus immersus RN42]|uniref:PhoD-like phosphatase domain-containing protein n=1 Tax=Ascobolus immersus RN42 TaxID=1160509 RepID=A0A3N4IL05_ASCIM|nr:hypothetical protein BJ508DRAFT_411655 [Ascobolus immersus RN42]
MTGIANLIPGVNDNSKKIPKQENVKTFTTKEAQIRGLNAEKAEIPGKDTNAEIGVSYFPPRCAKEDGLLCGPLLRYCGINYKQRNPLWRGSVLVVLREETRPGELEYGYANGRRERAEPECLLKEKGRAFWKYNLAIEISSDKSQEVQYEVTWGNGVGRAKQPIRDERFVDEKMEGQSADSREGREDGDAVNKLGSEEDGVCRASWWVPGRNENMRIMFHSCNGFSVGTDEEAFSGPALWNDVLRQHERSAFHVMIGGGDQVYSDAIRTEGGPLHPWATMRNPEKRRKAPFTKELGEDCDNWYFQNYCEWYSHPPFSTANRAIPQVNIWDDHDIIDGYGSYIDRFMRSDMFVGIGELAYKNYLLFQHHTKPNASNSDELAGGEDKEDSFVISKTKGIYIKHHPHNVVVRLGPEIIFLGIDARTERTRKMINTESTYDLVFDRVAREIKEAGEGVIKHLILLLGVPIFYPRLVWLETILQSPLFGALSFLNKRFGIASGLFNKFDGAAELLDDLDDHYCAHHHKHERNTLVLRLQRFSAEHLVRTTIVSGDVHLAAVGRFYSDPRMNIPVEQDPRYMVNVISSAITNKPPPAAIGRMIARRNKTHQLHRHAQEKLLDIFTQDVDGGSVPNSVTMPRRNYAILWVVPDAKDQIDGAQGGDAYHDPNLSAEDLEKQTEEKLKAAHLPAEKKMNHIGPSEIGAGPAHFAALNEPEHVGNAPAQAAEGSKLPIAPHRKPFEEGDIDTTDTVGEVVSRLPLWVCIRVERDQKDWAGRTRGYGFGIPSLDECHVDTGAMERDRIKEEKRRKQR